MIKRRLERWLNRNESLSLRHRGFLDLLVEHPILALFVSITFGLIVFGNVLN